MTDETPVESSTSSHPLDEEIKEICAQLGLKTMKKYRILVRRLVKTVGTDIKQLKIALNKAMLGK